MVKIKCRDQNGKSQNVETKNAFTPNLNSDMDADVVFLLLTSAFNMPLVPSVSNVEFFC